MTGESEVNVRNRTDGGDMLREFDSRGASSVIHSYTVLKQVNEQVQVTRHYLFHHILQGLKQNHSTGGGGLGQVYTTVG